MKSDSFLAEFQPVSTEQWEHAIRESIAGPDYPAKLIWHPEEALAIRPYFRAEDLLGLPFLNAAPGEFPYVRGTRTTGDWRIRERIDHKDPEEAGRAACAAVAAGAEEIAFTAATISSTSDVTTLLANLNEIPLHFGEPTCDSVRVLVDALRSRPDGATVSTDLDPLSDLDFSAELIRTAPLGFRPFTIHADDFLERGAGAVEEIGFTISAAVDFIDEMQKRWVNIDRTASSLGFSFAMGPEFFVQIAKLRAFRVVWAQVIESFGRTPESARAAIDARTARWNATMYDPHLNILRATTEAISAVLGGADSIEVAAFDECYRHPDDSTRRLARNTQLILKHEAHLSRVADPTGGSYLIESLTNSIATKAWKLFQDLEAAGGYRKARAEGVIDSVLQHREEARKQSTESRRLILVGTNRFANPAENKLTNVDPTRTDSTNRVADAFEALRLRTERAAARGIKPRILLAEIGDPKMRAARSQFAADFLACAGLQSQTKQFEGPEDIAATDADAIVICSSDPGYLPLVEKLMPLFDKHRLGTRVLVAGNPSSADQLTALGIFDFIHLRSNAVEVLSRVQKQIGIEG